MQTALEQRILLSDSQQQWFVQRRKRGGYKRKENISCSTINISLFLVEKLFLASVTAEPDSGTFLNQLSFS